MRIYKIFALTIFTHAAAVVSALLIALLCIFLQVIFIMIQRKIYSTDTMIIFSIILALGWYLFFVLLVRLYKKKVTFKIYN